MAYYKDNPTLIQASLLPLAAISPLPPTGTIKGSIARVYNRVGGLFDAFAKVTGVSREAALAVWYVESSGVEFIHNQPVLRFENHKFFDAWGDSHTSQFDQHFQFGGRNSVEGRRWENHRYRSDTTNDFKRFHGDQAKEYKALEFASTLGGLEAACIASSFGGPQILGSNHASVGYGSAAEMFEGFKDSERWHICAFFDFCNSHGIIDELISLSWVRFAKVYNGAGQAAEYGSRIGQAYDAALELTIPPAGTSFAPVIPASLTGVQTFEQFVQGLGLRHIKAYELLVKGNQHNNPDSAAYGLNTDPPREIWSNIIKTAKVADELRQRIGAPIVLLSVYRSEAYNTAIAGAGGSMHKKFNAIDLTVRNHMSPDTWANVLREMRTAGFFTGGIGIYTSFVHVDTRGTNADWVG
jgi:N-acetylmuramidase/Peptidase M15